MYYSLLKYLHIFTINITFAFFIIRGYWVIINSPSLTQGWVKIFPHINDTILLIAAINMSYLHEWRLFNQSWLIAKLCAVIIYIVLGSIALRPGRPKLIRLFAWLMAMLIFLYIVVVAVSKDPWPF